LNNCKQVLQTQLRLSDRIKARAKGAVSNQALQTQFVKKGKFKKGKKPWIEQSHKDGEGSSKNQ